MIFADMQDLKRCDSHVPILENAIYQDKGENRVKIPALGNQLERERNVMAIELRATSTHWNRSENSSSRSD